MDTFRYYQLLDGELEELGEEARYQEAEYYRAGDFSIGFAAEAIYRARRRERGNPCNPSS